MKKSVHTIKMFHKLDCLGCIDWLADQLPAFRGSPTLKIKENLLLLQKQFHSAVVFPFVC